MKRIFIHLLAILSLLAGISCLHASIGAVVTLIYEVDFMGFLIHYSIVFDLGIFSIILSFALEFLNSFKKLEVK